MAVRGTSRASYKKLSELGEKQQEVFNALKSIEPASDRDIAKHLGVSAHYVSPRRGELAQWGFVVESGYAYDKETQRKVIVWATTDPMANRQIQKAVGKPTHTEEKKSVNKFSLKLKNGQRFTISAAMKEEIEASIKSQRGTIELAGHVFALSNIALPIVPLGGPAPAEAPLEKEDTEEKHFIEVDGKWQPATETDMAMRRNKQPFRTQRIGVKTGRIHYDMLTYWQDDFYETLRDMKGAAL